jgi:DNA-damage-inducible protein J
LTSRRIVSTFITNARILMAKTLQIRIEEDLRTEAGEVLHEIGLDVPSAVRLFLTKVVQTRSIPFELRAPGIRVVEVAVDPATQARMDEIGSLWARKKPQRE